MRTRPFLLSLSLCIIIAPSSFAQRLSVNINREWKFFRGDPEDRPELPGYDDAAWESIHLPHSFSIPYFRGKQFYVGYGWYRKMIDIPAAWLARRVQLDFDGVFQEAAVYVNGKAVGRHLGGYTGFSYDITRCLHSGRNLIAVRVNNLWNPRLAPRAGEHVFSGGIYRDVYLRVTDEVAIRRNGVWVTTPGVADRSARVRVCVDIDNASGRRAHRLIRSIISDRNGKVLAVMRTPVDLPAGKRLTITQQSGIIPHPLLWTPETPVLYKVGTSVEGGDRLPDTDSAAFGFRWLRWSADSGLFVNGRHYVLRGANVHQDHAGWGDAVTHADIYRDVRLMKEAGFNFIRGSHYPHHPYFARVCDELGMFFLSENCFWGIGGFTGEDPHWRASAYPTREEDRQPFEQSVKQSLTEMIRINRDHPSILAWSMGNETFFSDPAVMPHVRTLLRSLVALAHRQDPTRIALIGGAQREGLDTLGDGAGYNGDGAVLFRHPGIPSIVTEYGSCVADRPGDYTPCWGDIKDDSTPLWRSGQAIWCGFDHGSIAGDMGKMGIVDYFRIPKRSWYWYRNAYRGLPPPQWPSPGTAAGLVLSADKTVLQGTDGTDDAQLMVRVVDAEGKALSNSPPVTLTILSGPGEFPTGRSITFHPTDKDDIRIQDGLAAIELRTYEGGQSRIRASSPGLRDDTLEIRTIGLPLFRDGVTPLATARRFNPDTSYWNRVQPAPLLVSVSRPARASSRLPRYPPSLANDGKTNTAWKAAPEDKAAWWELDMEDFYQVWKVSVNFPDSGRYHARLEVSADGKSWTEAGDIDSRDSRQGWSAAGVHTETGNRFLRLVFDESGPAAINEIKVFTQP